LVLFTAPEVWKNGELVGGLYGVRLEKYFLEKVCSANKAMQANMLL
jgi:Leu/Phe-tRNA-protein transferase